MSESTAAPLDELGPVDYLVVEFPTGAQNFTGETAAELANLSDFGAIRVLDLLILQKNQDGSIDAVENLAEAMLPGSVAGVLVWENRWGAPFARATRNSGGQLIATGRIPIRSAPPPPSGPPPSSRTVSAGAATAATTGATVVADGAGAVAVQRHELTAHPFRSGDRRHDQ